jgi:hypothetical protein
VVQSEFHILSFGGRFAWERSCEYPCLTEYMPFPHPLLSFSVAHMGVQPLRRFCNLLCCVLKVAWRIMQIPSYPVSRICTPGGDIRDILFSLQVEPIDERSQMYVLLERLFTHDVVCPYKDLSAISRDPGELTLYERNGGRKKLPYWRSTIQGVTLVQAPEPAPD